MENGESGKQPVLISFEDAKAFYIRHGFADSPLYSMTLLLPIDWSR